MSNQIPTVRFYWRNDTDEIRVVVAELKAHIADKWPDVTVVEDYNQPAAGTIILGGDGVIISAVHQCELGSSIFMGLNMGTVGFMAAANDRSKFMAAVDAFLSGTYRPVHKLLLYATVERAGEVIWQSTALNEFNLQSLLGVVEATVQIDGHIFQHIRGTGVLVATPTGSTAYNLSAHGPILMPDIDGIVLTELLDHNVPTPSLILRSDQTIAITVDSFRASGLMTLTSTGEAADVLLIADGSDAHVVMQPGDKITVKKHTETVTFAETDQNAFLHSLHDKFNIG